MTTPSEPDDIEAARVEADEALSRAQDITARSRTIGERWRQSRQDNNFRQMLRRMAATERAAEG